MNSLLFLSITDELKQWCLADDCYQKLYPAIGSNILLTGLINFVENERNRPTKSGISNSSTYRKEGGRKIDSSRNYKLVHEYDELEIFHLYVEITKGDRRGMLILIHFSIPIDNEYLVFFRNIDYFKMLTNIMECEFLLTVTLETMMTSGANSVVKDLKDAADREKLFIARERCKFVNRWVLANIAVTTKTITALCNVTKLGNDNKQKPKQQQASSSVIKPSSAMTEKPVPSISRCSAKSSDDEQDDIPESIPKSTSRNTRSTPKSDRLRPRAVGAGAKALTNNSCKSSMNSSSSKTKRKEVETDDEHVKKIPKRKK